MTQTQGTETLEIELKFEAPDSVDMPAPDAFSRIGLHPDVLTVHELSAVYYDTRDGTLSSGGVAVRRRSGGVDEGWHVKQRTPQGTREFHWPLAEAAPAELFVTLDAMVGDVRGALEPRATLNTLRRAVQLRDSAGEAAIELADDQVHSQDHRTGIHRAWREWEAELAPAADVSWLTRVESVLTAAGAQRSLSIAKIARASGRLVDFAIAKEYPAGDLAAIALIDLADRMAGNSIPESVPDPRCAELRNLAAAIRRDRH